MHIEFIFMMFVTTLLVFISVLIHYETLRFVTGFVEPLELHPYLRFLVVIIGVFIGHTLEVWVFAFAYFGVYEGLGMGGFAGDFGFEFEDYVYFSVVTYTSLGFGDVWPVGGFRLISGVEALTGLLMIGWSASFTYLMMTRFWDLHPKRKRRDSA